MAKITGSAGNNQDVDAGANAARIAGYGPDIGALGVNGRYQLASKSGALTAIAARTATAGHLFHAYNKHATKLVLVHRCKAVFTGTVGASTAQEFGMAIMHTTAATVQATGGAALSLADPEGKLRKSHAAASAVVDAYFANSTGALTAGTYTPKTSPLEENTAWCLAASAAVPIPQVITDFDRRTAADGPLVLEPGEGILVANSVLMANSLAGVLRVHLDFSVCDAFPQ